jgi:acetyl-CoA C-acetyltransferase
MPRYSFEDETLPVSDNVYVLGAARTPIGSFQGALASHSAPDLGAHAIRAALNASGIADAAVNEVIMGNVISAGLKQAPARQAMRSANLADSVHALTVNKVCGSGMKATMLAHDLIRAGSADVVVSGGMESMTNAPYLLTKARAGQRMGHGQMFDSMFTDGLEDAETGGAMGAFAQSTADDYQLTREAMDAYAIQSLERARAAMTGGQLADEIAAMDLAGGTVAEDEQPGRAKVEKIPTLRPAFKADGTITAANASSISDGASALVLGGDSALNSATPSEYWT